MDERYSVAFGYPDANVRSMPPAMRAIPQMRGRLSTEHFRKWSELLATLAQSDTATCNKSRTLTMATIPPTNHMPCLFDVMIWQYVDDSDWVTVTGSCSLGSIVVLAEFLRHWCAVEDELEAEMGGVSS